MATKNKSKIAVITSSMAKLGDGTIQITFTIPFSIISKKRKTVVEKLAKNIDVPGFRKGNAPLDKVKGKIPQSTLIEQTLAELLPQEISKVLKQENIKPAIYPKLELLKYEENNPWQIRATTCEVPKITLGEYKKSIIGTAKASAIWTPDMKDKQKDQKKELSNVEKEQKVLDAIIKEVKVDTPKLLVDEEVNSRLSKLLARIEKLSLNLDNYLTSIGKTAVTLRSEYEKQAMESITIDLALLEIAKKEKIEASEKEVDAAVEASKANPNFDKSRIEEQKPLIKSVLARRAALDKLVSLM